MTVLTIHNSKKVTVALTFVLVVKTDVLLVA